MELYREEKKFVEDSFFKILIELSKEKYKMPKERLCELLQRYFCVSIINRQQPSILNEFHSLDGNVCFQQTSKNDGCSHILEYPPIYTNNKFLSFVPIINIVKYPTENEFESSTYHELAHLFSSSNWATYSMQPLVLQHISGINIDNYDYSNGKIKKTEIQSVTLVDEFLNDFIGMLLYHAIEGKPYFHNYVSANKRNFYEFVRSQIHKNSNGEYRNLIRGYFSNDIRTIENILLLNSGFRNFKELQNKFTNKNINEEMEK